MRVAAGTFGAAGLIVACSLTDLDGFTGGARDGGASSSSSSSGAPGDGGPSPTSDGGSEAGPPTDPYGDAVRTDLPSSWWRFEDPVGSMTLRDEMKKTDGRALPRGESPVSIRFAVEGAVGKGAAFGANAGFFDVGDVFDFTGTSEYALEAWLLDDAPTETFEGIFQKRRDDANGADQGWLIFLNKDSRRAVFQFWKDHDVTVSAPTNALGNGWHHVVLTATKRDGAVDFVSYLDGEAREGDQGIVVEQAGSDQHLTIGFAFSGTLDELAVYEHPLAPERVLAHYKAAKSR